MPRTKSSSEKDAPPPRRKKKAGPLLRLIRGLFLLAFVLVLVGAATAGGLLWHYTRDLPSLDEIGKYQPKQVVRVLDRRGNVLGELGSEKRTVIPYEKIPEILINAVIAAEDATFFENPGLDIKGIARALVETVIGSRDGRPSGGSTITQQVIKRLLLTPERTIKRKVQEIVLAYHLTQKLSKQQILNIYLNDIYYGHGRYGCEEAARFFFGKTVADVTVGEAALLAGLPQSPERLSPLKHPEAAKNRQRYVLGRMAELGFIQRAVADTEAREPIVIVRSEGISQAPEVVTMVTSLKDALSAQGGSIQTTIDADLQGLARSALEKGLEALDERQGYREPSAVLKGSALAHKRELLLADRAGVAPKGSKIVEGLVVESHEDRENPDGGRLLVDLGGVKGQVDLAQEVRYQRGKKPIAKRFPPGSLVRVRVAGVAEEGLPLPLALELGPQAAMVVLDVKTGDVLALVGGYGFEAGMYDRARNARRQPGSAFKPLVYGAALETRRFTAASVLNDAPEVYDLWKPSNYEKNFRGPVRLREALAHSINTIAIKLLSEVGIAQLRSFAVRMGLETPIHDEMGLSLALGSLAVTPFELASGYLPFFNGGLRVRPRVMAKVGEREEPASVRAEAISPDLAYVMVSMMKSVVTDGTARGVLARMRRPVAGKTGTSNEQRDAWFVGGTPSLLAAVWVGFDDMKQLGRGETGGGAALPIWAEFMARATEGEDVRDFVAPPTVQVQRIDPTTGLLPAGERVGIEEVFLPGTEPVESAGPGGSASADKLLLGQ